MNTLKVQSVGKAYAHKSGDRKGDFYSSPKSLVWAAKDIIKREFPDKPILEPCAGQNAITDELWKLNYYTTSNDLYRDNDDVMFAYDYLTNDILDEHKYIITNPPFSLWDDFVIKAKSHCDKFMFIGRLNYRGTAGRTISEDQCNGCKYSKYYGLCAKDSNNIIPVSKQKESVCIRDFKYDPQESFIYKNLKAIYPFNRYVDYQTPYRDDGLFHVGAMATAWFLWDMDFTGDPITKILDVQKYAKLGQYRK